MSGIPMLAGLIRPRDIVVEDKFDKILKSYLDGKLEALPQDLQNCLERWSMINSMLRKGLLVKKGKNEFYKPYKYADLVDFIVQTYKVSVRTAYDDVKSAKRFFAIDESKVDNDFAKGLFLEKLEEMMAESYGKGDAKSAASFAKVIVSIRQWDKPQEDDMPKYAEMQLPTLILVADPSELGFPKLDNPEAAVKRILAKRKKSKIDNIFAGAEVVQLMDKNGRAEDLAE